MQKDSPDLLPADCESPQVSNQESGQWSSQNDDTGCMQSGLHLPTAMPHCPWGTVPTVFIEGICGIKKV